MYPMGVHASQVGVKLGSKLPQTLGQGANKSCLKLGFGVTSKMGVISGRLVPVAFYPRGSGFLARLMVASKKVNVPKIAAASI